MKKIKYIYIHMYINKSPHKTLRPIDFDFVLMNFAGSAVFWVKPGGCTPFLPHPLLSLSTSHQVTLPYSFLNYWQYAVRIVCFQVFIYATALAQMFN